MTNHEDLASGYGIILVKRDGKVMPTDNTTKQDCYDVLFKILKEKEWIPCNNRLPEKQGQYLITSQCGVIDVLYYSPDLYSVDKHDFYRYKFHRKAGWYDYDSECGYFEYSTPKAWQELPEPYEEEEDD